MKLVKLALAGLVAVLLVGCTDPDTGNRQVLGSLSDDTAGGPLGTKGGQDEDRSAAGTLAGAWIGNEIGKSLNRADQEALNKAQNIAYDAPIGQDIVWNNPNSGNHGAVTPWREGRDPQTGDYCREFQHDVTIGGETQQAYGAACRQPNGAWKIM